MKKTLIFKVISEIYPLKDLYMNVYSCQKVENVNVIKVSIHNSLNVEQLKYPSTGDWINKIWYSHPMK